MVILHQTYGKGPFRYSKRGNRLPPHGLLFLISSKGSFICIIRQDNTPVVEHWLQREIAQWVHSIDPTTHCTMSECSCPGATSHSIIWKKKRKEFNDRLDTWLHCTRHCLRNNDNKRENPLLPLYGLLFSKGSFICTIPHTG